MPSLLLLLPPRLPARATPPATANTAMTTHSQPLPLFPESVPFSAGMLISGVDTDSGAFFVTLEPAIRTSSPARLIFGIQRWRDVRIRKAISIFHGNFLR
ncbi:MAG: hypothetical protein HZA08_13430 [Nitrospirae bacterium]|nr:hypothetical protein [Nitrospirota bacterium]